MSNIYKLFDSMIKKINASVKSINGSKPDTAGNVEVEIPEGFSGSWNDLQDKPFYEEASTKLLTIEWDGNTEGLEEANNESGSYSSAYCYYRVSDKLPEISNGAIDTVYIDGEEVSLTSINDGEAFIRSGAKTVIFVPTDNSVIQYVDINPNNAFVFPKAGVYVSGRVTSITISFDYTEMAVKPLDVKFLPTDQIDAAINYAIEEAIGEAIGGSY